MDPRPPATDDCRAYVEDTRKIGLKLLDMFEFTEVRPTKAMKKWFEDDLGYYGLDVRECYRNAKDYVERNLKALTEEFPFEVTEWLDGWYSLMPELLLDVPGYTTEADWILFFTIVGEFPAKGGIPFCCLIKALNVKQNQLLREEIYKAIAEDEVLRNKVLNWEPLPSIYVHYCNYSTIRRKVLKILKPKTEKCPNGMRAYFKEAEKLIRSSKVSPEEALETVLAAVEKPP